MPPIHLVPRDIDHSSPTSPIYIAAYAVGGVIVLGLIAGLALRYHRKRTAVARRGAAFLSVRGLVPEGHGGEKWSESTPDPIYCQDPFGRDQTSSIITLPEKAFPPPNTKFHHDVIEYHRQSGTFPKPFSFALGAGTDSPRGSGMSEKRDSFSQRSFLSMSSGNSRYSVQSGTSVTDASTGSMRQVHQLFTPVLPDELLITKLGKQLNVIQSFDDGWCVVGKEGGSFAKSLLKPNTGSNIGIGVVPAWCFMKPAKGLKAERPIRSSSLGITVQMQSAGLSSRQEVVSWSNF